MMTIAQNRESGSMTFLMAALILPLLFVVFSLSLDLGAYYTTSQKFNDNLSRAAMYGVRFLPYLNETESAVRSYLSANGISPEIVQTTIDNDTIKLRLSAETRLNFPRLLGIEAKIPLSAVAWARGAPFDSFIAVDVGSYLAAELPLGTPWGDSISEPSAQFFDEFQSSALPITDESGHVLDPRLLTEQCFNSAFMALKHSAINAYEYLASFNLNAVGLGFYPGYGRYVDIAREIVPGACRNLGIEGEATFVGYIGRFNRDIYCAAAAERERFNAAYVFPAPNLKREGAACSPPGQPRSMLDSETLEYDPAYAPFLRTREVIWSKAIHEGAPSDIRQLLSEVRSKLLSAPVVEARAGLLGSAIKTGIIFAGDVPRFGAVRWSLGDPFIEDAMTDELLKFREYIERSAITVKLYYVFFKHEGLKAYGVSEGVAEELQSFFDRFALHEDTHRFEIKVIYADDPIELQNKVTAILVLDKRTTVLSR